MGRLANAVRSFLRVQRGTLLVVVIGGAALAFIANDARNQRLRAGISDDCAHAQYAMQMFPMNRCFSIEDFVNMHRGDGGGAPAQTPNDTRHARSEGDVAEHKSACSTSVESAALSNPERPQMPDYVAALLQGFECEPEH